MRVTAILVLAVCAIACGGEGPGNSFVIPGPAVPSPLPAGNYVWDTREELDVWVNNAVTRGPLSLEGAGAEAFVKVSRADQQWVLRGPDFSPPAAGMRTLRIRYKWRLDPSVPASAARDVYVTARFQTLHPLYAFDPTAQGLAHINMHPNDEWTEITFIIDQYTPPIDVQYCYLHSTGANRGVIDIDRIEMIR